MKPLTILLIILATIMTIGCPRTDNNISNQESNAMKNPFKKDKIVEFETFRLKISRMRGGEVYEGQKTATGIHLEHYAPGKREYDSVNRVYKETKKMIKTIEGDQQLYEEIAQLFAEYKIKRWDGFHGANPPGLRDGTMMDFEATLTDGTRIDADGSNNFPKHFRDFQEKLQDIFERELTSESSIEFESFSLEINAARGSRELYTGERTKNGVQLKHFDIDKRTDAKKTINSVKGDQQLYQKLCKDFADCQIEDWDGFNGQNPPDTYDGWTMTFDAQLTNGKHIHAKGTNNFPESYHTVKSAIQEACVSKR